MPTLSEVVHVPPPKQYRACKFTTFGDSTKIYLIEYNPGLPDLPCNDVLYGQERTVGAEGMVIPAGACLQQRRQGLCVREPPIGLEVPESILF